jgi:hypothetical protein
MAIVGLGLVRTSSRRGTEPVGAGAGSPDVAASTRTTRGGHSHAKPAKDAEWALKRLAKAPTRGESAPRRTTIFAQDTFIKVGRIDPQGICGHRPILWSSTSFHRRVQRRMRCLAPALLATRTRPSRCVRTSRTVWTDVSAHQSHARRAFVLPNRFDSPMNQGDALWVPSVESDSRASLSARGGYSPSSAPSSLSAKSRRKKNKKSCLSARTTRVEARTLAVGAATPRPYLSTSPRRAVACRFPCASTSAGPRWARLAAVVT